MVLRITAWNLCIRKALTAFWYFIQPKIEIGLGSIIAYFRVTASGNPTKYVAGQKNWRLLA